MGMVDWEQMSLVAKALIACDDSSNRTEEELYDACLRYLGRNNAEPSDYEELKRRFDC